jgi:hypothetical protein
MTEMALLIRDAFKFGWKMTKITFFFLLFLSLFKIFDKRSHGNHKMVEVASAHPANFYDFENVVRSK